MLYELPYRLYVIINEIGLRSCETIIRHILVYSPRWYLYFFVVVGLACLNEPESHAGGNICYQ
jgi:hypothetical protein